MATTIRVGERPSALQASVQIEKSERDQIRDVRYKFDFELKHYFGKYRIVGVDQVNSNGAPVEVVYLVSRGRYYKTRSQNLGFSYGHTTDDGDVLFVNLTKKGHWMETEYAKFYLPMELSLTFLHEYLHSLKIADNKTKKSEEEQIVSIESLLRKESDYKALVVG